MGLLDTLDNAGSRVFGWESAAEEDRKAQGEKANQIAQQQQSHLAQQNSGLHVNSYDSPAISQCVNWSGFGHAQIYQTNQESIDQGKVGETAKAWLDLAKGLRERGENYATDIAKIVDGGWQGEAASNAREVGKPASDWMKASADAFEMTGNNLNAAGEAAGQASKMVEKPEGFSWGEAAASSVPFGLAGGGVNALSQMEEQEQAEKAAQETMARVYSPTLTQVDAKMPQYQAPDGSTKEPPPVPPSDRTDWGGGGGGGGIPGGGAGGGAGGGIPGGGIPGGGIPGGGYNGGGIGSGGIPGGGYTNPAGTNSQWADQPGIPGGGMPGGGVPGGPPGGGGAGMAGGIAAGLGAGGAGGMGRGMGAGAGGMAAGGRAGAGGLGAGAGAGAAGAGARSAGRGMGGMGGMGGAGQRGQGSEDEEHERPSWLEEQDDVWMNDMPRTAPPVLGE